MHFSINSLLFAFLHCSANPWTGFYTIGTSAMNKLMGFPVLAINHETQLQYQFIISEILGYRTQDITGTQNVTVYVRIKVY